LIPAADAPKSRLDGLMAKAILMKLYLAGSTYKGDVDSEGKYHGKGLLTFIDGTSYEGDFQHGFREGHGILNLPDGSVYKGGFKGELQNGFGELFMRDGTKIKTTWSYGRKNGNGTITDPSGKVKEVIFYHDAEYKQADQNPDCWNMLPTLGL